MDKNDQCLRWCRKMGMQSVPYHGDNVLEGNISSLSCPVQPSALFLFSAEFFNVKMNTEILSDFLCKFY